MASFDYAKMAATARNLLDRFGATVQVVRVTGASTDPVTGMTTPGTTETFEPKGVLLKFPDRLIDGTRIKQSDRRLILDDTFEPTLSDKPVIEGQEWSLIEDMTVSPAGVPIVYEFLARR